MKGSTTLEGALQALTIWQPWAWAIARAGKDVENRTWHPPRSAIGRPLAIHAGKRFDDDAVESLWLTVADELQDDVPECAEACTRGAIIAVATLAEVKALGEGTARFSPWYGGPVGWVLEDVIELAMPVPCRGAQGLWTVPEHLAADVWGQL